jgi:hypothetical protein
MTIITHADFIAARKEACDAGFITLTSGSIEDDNATFALAWLPLDSPDTFTQEVRDRHEANMRKIGAIK